MFFDEAVERQVGQDIAAVNDKGLIPDPLLNIFNASPSLQQVRFVHQFERPSVVFVFWKLRRKLLRQMVRIDPEPLDTGLTQMIKGKGNQRLPKNWK